MSENAVPAYDPYKLQPRSLGELDHWLRAAAASLRATRIPFPVFLDSPPIPGLDRLVAYCAAKYGLELTSEAVRRLIGEYALARDISTDESKAALLQDVADTLAPRSRKSSTPPRGPQSPSAAAGASTGFTNPLHSLIGQLYALLTGLERCHQASTTEELDSAQGLRQSLTSPFWATHRIPSEAQRGLADPALAWWRRQGVDVPEATATIEQAAACVTDLVVRPWFALPSVYSNKDDASKIWEQQGDFLVEVHRKLDALRRLTALAGEPWQWDGRLPWDRDADGQKSEPEAVPPDPEREADWLNSRPDSPLPPDPLVEAAVQDIPQAIADMDNASENGAPAPAPGQRIVLYRSLIKALGDRWNHGRAAAGWAIHRLVEEGVLTLRPGCDASPMYQSRPGGMGGGEPLVIRDLRESLVESTPRLWESWHEELGRRSGSGAAGPEADLARSETAGHDESLQFELAALAERIRQLMDRLASANERFSRATLRLQATPGPADLAPALTRNRPDRPATLSDVFVPCEDGLAIHDLWGAGGVQQGDETRVLLMSLVKGGLNADDAAMCTSDLAAECGRLYQTLPANVAPIYGTTSPRNLWATILFARLRGTPWVQETQGYEFIPQPLAASIELWRRLLYGFPRDEQVALGSPERLRPDISDAAREIAEVNRLHDLAVRCANAVLRLDALRVFADGDPHARDALLELQHAVALLPELPLHDDPFSGENVVELVGVTAPSAHAATFEIALRNWQASHLTHLEPRNATEVQGQDGSRYTRVEQELVRQIPTEIEWSLNVWKQIREQLEDYPAPESKRLQALITLERNRAARRLEERWGANSPSPERTASRPSGEASSPPGTASPLAQDSRPNPAQEIPPDPGKRRGGPNRCPKEPSKEAFMAYRANIATGKTQTELAQMLSRELKRPVDQGTVSRWIKQVKHWLKAGNVLPDLSAPSQPKPTAMDPGRIDLGKRNDGRPKDKRGRRKSSPND